MLAIKTIDLTKRYGKTVAVDRLNLEIKKGEIFSLLGVNGAGKTTTVKMLSCLTMPNEGDALVCGKSIRSEGGEVKRLISVSPQETAIAPFLSVKENLELMCGIYGFSKEDAKRKISDICEKLSLDGVLLKKAGNLSGGYGRRLSIAMALISEPSVLFLDEPTLGLDVIARSELWDLIRSLKGRVTIVLTTHYMDEAEALSDRIGIMSGGCLLAVGTSRELIELTKTDGLESAFVSIVRRRI